MFKKNIHFLFFNIIFNCIFISSLYSSVPHAVVGTVQYADGSFPSQVSWNAFITTRSTDILYQGPPSLYDSLSGGFLIQCAGFSSWTAGETLHVEITDNQTATGSVNVVLTYDPVNDAGVIVLKEPVEVEYGEIEQPAEFELYQNYPNPFNPETAVSFRIEKPQFVTLTIYNSGGQYIKTLFSGFKNSGSYKVVWNGRDSGGQEAASGLYIYVLKGENFTKQLNAILIR